MGSCLRPRQIIGWASVFGLRTGKRVGPPAGSGRIEDAKEGAAAICTRCCKVYLSSSLQILSDLPSIPHNTIISNVLITPSSPSKV